VRRLQELEHSATQDALVREKIANLPTEVTDPTYIDKVDGMWDGCILVLFDRKNKFAYGYIEQNILRRLNSTLALFRFSERRGRGGLYVYEARWGGTG